MRKLSSKHLLSILKSKSNIDYVYCHIFENKVLDIDYSKNSFTQNYILYILNSDFSFLSNLYSKISDEAITDVFIDSLKLSFNDFKELFWMHFKELFWIKIQWIEIPKIYYDELWEFLSNNALDINRIFLQSTKLNYTFFNKLRELTWFKNLSFLSFDDNQIWNQGLESILYFLSNNSIRLEYMSLISAEITNITPFFESDSLSNTRIIDISNNSIDMYQIFHLLEFNKYIEELFIKQIKFSDTELQSLILFLDSSDLLLDYIWITLQRNQQELWKKLIDTGVSKNIFINITYFDDVKIIKSSTVYIKWSHENISNTNNHMLYYDGDSIEDFCSMYHKIINNSINLFIFEVNNYDAIDYLLSKYPCNYIYIENYYITNQNFYKIIHTISRNPIKRYKLNLISIEINYIQLEYLIDNFPINIKYIEINLNKIVINREKYIFKLLQNKAFIFENMEMYKKIFK